ncbi:MAG: hypothetical protein MPJ24_10165 [Pirellulaceae bacterium]|nr:hypothetical protein [Pirellulaceae bacterium]
MTHNFSLEDSQWLTSPEAADYLQYLQENASLKPTTLVTRLRKRLSPSRTHLLLELFELRQRAAMKFGTLANKLFFTRKAYEQASSLNISAHKADRFTNQPSVADLCCGIGGDLLALQKVAPVTGIDLDQAILHLTQENSKIAANDQPTDSPPNFICQNVAQVDLTSFSSWHLDPDRRVQSTRTISLAAYDPQEEIIRQMLAQNPHGGVKVAPACQIPDDWKEETERHWIGEHKECKQQILWFGDLAKGIGRKTLTIFTNTSSGGLASETTLSLPSFEEVPAIAENIGEYLFDPHSVITASHSLNTLSHQYGLSRIDAESSYLTGERPNSPEGRFFGLTPFRIKEVFPFKEGLIKTYLKTNKIGLFEIKKRGVSVEPHKLLKKFKNEHPPQKSLLISSFGKKSVAILAQRVDHP